MIEFGDFLFRQRNKLFPVLYLLLLAPSPAVTTHLNAIMLAGFLVSATGQAVRMATIGLEYIIRGGRGGRMYAENLVTGGIFAHCRNPLYLGNVLILGGLGLMANSAIFMFIAFPLFVLAYVAIVRAEEHFLSETFGAAYEEYCRDVNRWLPRLSGLGETLKEGRFNWMMVLIREYTTTYIWLSGVVLLAMKNLAQVPDNTFYREYWPWGAGALGLLLVAYVVIRTLKIRRIITAEG